MNDCCKDQTNLSEPQPYVAGKPELLVRTCQVCGGRHFELEADALNMAAEGEPLA